MSESEEFICNFEADLTNIFHKRRTVFYILRQHSTKCPTVKEKECYTCNYYLDKMTSLMKETYELWERKNQIEHENI